MSKWLNKWHYSIQSMKDNSALDVHRHQKQLTTDLKQDSQSFVNQYIKGIESLANIGYIERESIVEPVNSNTWYLIRFIYGDRDESEIPACIMKTSDINMHLADRN